MRNIRIGDYLVSKGLITEEQLIKVLQVQKESQGTKRFGEIIIELGMLSEVKFAQALASKLKVPFEMCIRDRSQWNEIKNKINQVDTIKERVQKKYNESVELGNLFVDLKRAYTLEKFIQEYFNKNGVYINTNASYSDPSVITLTPYSINYESLDYSIGQSANLNSTDIEDQTEEDVYKRQV